VHVETTGAGLRGIQTGPRVMGKNPQAAVVPARMLVAKTREVSFILTE